MAMPTSARRKPTGRVTPRKTSTLPRKKPAPRTTNGKVAAAIPDGKLRLLKVKVQPVYVLETDDGLIEVGINPVEEINGAAWVEWATTQFTPAALEKRRSEVVIVEGAN